MLKQKSMKNYHFIGLGGAGCNIAQHLHINTEHSELTLITSENNKFVKKGYKTIVFNSPKNYDTVKDWYKKDTNHLIELISFEDIEYSSNSIVICIGLGGYTGTMLGKSLLEFLIKMNKHFVLLASTPFQFESHRIEVSEHFKAIFYKEHRIKFFDLNEKSNLENQLSIDQYFNKINDDILTYFNQLPNLIKIQPPLFWLASEILYNFSSDFGTRVEIIELENYSHKVIEYNPTPIIPEYWIREKHNYIIDPKKHAIKMTVPFIYPRAYVPEVFNDFKVFLTTRINVNLLPKEFNAKKEKAIEKVFTKNAFIEFVNRGEDIIKIALGDPCCTKDEILDHLSFLGNFDAYVALIEKTL